MGTNERRSGFGQGFSKEVDSILTAYQLGVVYHDEVRDNLRVAGMELKREAKMGDYTEGLPEGHDLTPEQQAELVSIYTDIAPNDDEGENDA